MLESEVYDEDDKGKEKRGHQDQESGALELVPGGPADLLCQLDVRLFKIVNELSHLCF